MSNGRTNQARGSGLYANFCWPPQDDTGIVLPGITVHTWQCCQCGQVVGHGSASQAEGILALQNHRCSSINPQSSHLAAD